MLTYINNPRHEHQGIHVNHTCISRSPFPCRQRCMATYSHPSWQVKWHVKYATLTYENLFFFAMYNSPLQVPPLAANVNCKTTCMNNKASSPVFQHLQYRPPARYQCTYHRWTGVQIVHTALFCTVPNTQYNGPVCLITARELLSSSVSTC